MKRHFCLDFTIAQALRIYSKSVNQSPVKWSSSVWSEVRVLEEGTPWLILKVSQYLQSLLYDSGHVQFVASEYLFDFLLLWCAESSWLTSGLSFVHVDVLALIAVDECLVSFNKLLENWLAFHIIYDFQNILIIKN